LADYLSTRGIGPEVIVPLCFEKSLWAIVSLLAVLKAGGAFVLLDISQPVSRLESIIQQTEAKFAMSSTQYSETCQSLIDEAFVVNATIFSRLESRPKFSCSSVKPHNAAYIIFTSGSTGKPKGVVLEHLQLSTSCKKSGLTVGFKNRP
jgi:non-ribosomal peptide synthetase component F